MKKILLIIFSVLLILFLFLFWGGKQFTEMSLQSSIAEFRDSINFNNKEYFSFRELEDQPKLVENYFRSVIFDSIPKPKLVTVEQIADFKTSVNSEWMPIKATQYFTVEKPNFIWYSEMQTSKFFWVNAIDSYINRQGNMLIKLNSSITIADSWGIELDKSGLFRYISEAILFPTKLLPNDNILWNVLDSNTAEIKFIDGEVSVVAKLFFDIDDRIYKIQTYDKYRALEEGYKKSLYTVYLYEYKNFNNMFNVPTYIEVEWELESGSFKYGKFSIQEITYE